MGGGGGICDLKAKQGITITSNNETLLITSNSMMAGDLIQHICSDKLKNEEKKKTVDG